MADFVITVSNSIRFLGGGPSTKWSTNPASTYTMVWGTSKWGEGTEDIPNVVEAIISSSFSLSPALRFDVTNLVETSLVLTTEIMFDHVISIQGTISPLSETSSEGLKSGSWDYVFPSNTVDAETRTVPTYTSGTAGALAWTSGVTGTTIWS